MPGVLKSRNGAPPGAASVGGTRSARGGAPCAEVSSRHRQTASRLQHAGSRQHHPAAVPLTAWRLASGSPLAPLLMRSNEGGDMEWPPASWWVMTLPASSLQPDDSVPVTCPILSSWAGSHGHSWAQELAACHRHTLPLCPWWTSPYPVEQGGSPKCIQLDPRLPSAAMREGEARSLLARALCPAPGRPAEGGP